MKVFYVFILSLFFGVVISQNNPDRLIHKVQTARRDTAVYNAYMDLGNYFQNSNPDTAIYYHTKAEKVAEKIPGVEGELRKGEAIRQKGWDNFLLSDYTQALNLFRNALKIAEKYMQDKEYGLKAKTLWARSMVKIGIIYYEQDNFTKALECYYNALKINEEIGNKKSQADNFVNIGNIYYEQGNYAKALDCYFKALQISEEFGDKKSQALNLGNIGIIYDEQGNSVKALEYYFKALKIDEELGNKNAIARHLGNIGIAYKAQGNLTKALEYYFKALKINDETGNKKKTSYQFVKHWEYL